MTEPMSPARRLLRAIEPLIFARRAVTMSVLLVITVFLGWQASGIRQDAGFDKMLPLEHPYLKVYKQYQPEFGGANVVQVALIQKKGDIYNRDFLSKLKLLTDAVSALPGIDPTQVHSLFTPDVRYIEVIEGGFRGANVIPSDFSAASPTAEILGKVRANVGKAGIIGRYVSNDQRGAMVFAEVLEVDPITGTKLDYRDLARALEDQIRDRFKSETTYEYKAEHDIGPYKAGDVVFHAYADPGSSGYLAAVRAERNNEDGTPLLIPAEDLDVVARPNPDYAPNLDLQMIGFTNVVGDVIGQTKEVIKFFLIALAVTMVLLWLCIGSFKLAALPVLGALVAVIWELGLLKLLGFGLDPFTSFLPLLIFAISVSHAMHHVTAWIDEITSHERSSFDAALITWRRLGIYRTTAIIAAAAAFGNIALIPIGMLRELSLNALLGMLAIFVVNVIMIPIWLTWLRIGDLKSFASKQNRRDAIFDGFWRLISAMTDFKPAVAALLICSMLLGWGLWKGKAVQIGDNQRGVQELSSDSRYNRDSKAITENFALGTDVIKVISETDPDSCTQSQVMEQIDTLAWKLDNTAGVRATQSLPQWSKIVYTAFSEGSPKFKVLARNKDAMSQAITPITPATGMMNANCSAMPIWIFTANHAASTIKRVVATVAQYQADNAADFFETHKDVDANYCAAKTKALRTVGTADERLRLRRNELRKQGLRADGIAAHADVVALGAKLDEAKARLSEQGRSCPVNFALATGPVGVIAATNDVVEHQATLILPVVYIAITICLYLSFGEWISVAVIVLPLALASWLSYAVMASLGIAMKVTTLPIVAIAVALGVDYGVYVYARLADAVSSGCGLHEAYFKTLKVTGKAIMLTGVALGLSVATWLFSGFQLQRDMGKLLVFIFAGNMVAALALLPAIARFLLTERKQAAGNTPLMPSRH